jgi:MFS family permease
MIFPLLPLFLTETLRAGPGFLGFVEGVADTVSSLLKLVSGYLSDRLGRRKPLVLFGYGLAAIARPLVALATAPWHVLAVRLTDRMGKGVRASPRDALIADAAQTNEAGRAFGFHRAMDHAGAVVGPLVAAGVMALGLSMRNVFWLAAIPGALAIVVLLTVREHKDVAATAPAPSLVTATATGKTLPRSLYTYLAILLVFSLGNSSDAFLLLRARELGLRDEAIPVLWALLNLSKLGSSLYGGRLSDAVPRSRMILAGWAVYAVIYLGLALAQGPVAAWVLFVIYGVYHGLTEPAEKALIKDLVPADRRGQAYGYYNFIIGISALPASLLTGWLWRVFGAPWALGVGAGFAAVAALLLASWSTRRFATG